MAKATIGFSRAKGKVGGLVFRHEAGIGTIAQEYNGSPKNPRTIAQTKQRGKMNLAGRISKTISPEMLVGFGGNGRFNRSKFVSNLLLNMTSSNEQRATVPIDYIKFSEGVAYDLDVSVAFTAAENKLAVTCSRNGNENVMGARIIVLISENGNYRRAQMTDVVLTSAQPVVANINIMAVPNTTQADPSFAHVFVIPLVNTGSAESLSFAARIADDTMEEENVPMTGSLVAGITRMVSEQAGLVASTFEGSVNIDAV